MQPVPDCSILKQYPSLTFQDGAYTYRIERQGNQSVYSVTDGKDTITEPLEYAFGLGKAGQTYIFEREHKFYESRVSFFQSISGLDLTLGATTGRPRNLIEASGRVMQGAQARECFGCHTTSSERDSFQTQGAFTPGVTCEHCHGSAVEHLDGFHRGKPVAMPKLSSMTTEELGDFCGQCHRTWAQIAAEGPHNINNVRFQPYRLASSKCYNPVDRRIACISCHDVHQEVVESDTYYDAKCLACHSDAKRCAVSSRNCVSCHMPKLELPGSHYKFADHQIRIVAKDQAYPP